MRKAGADWINDSPEWHVIHLRERAEVLIKWVEVNRNREGRLEPMMADNAPHEVRAFFRRVHGTFRPERWRSIFAIRAVKAYATSSDSRLEVTPSTDHIDLVDWLYTDPLRMGIVNSFIGPAITDVLTLLSRAQQKEMQEVCDDVRVALARFVELDGYSSGTVSKGRRAMAPAHTRRNAHERAA